MINKAERYRYCKKEVRSVSLPMHTTYKKRKLFEKVYEDEADNIFGFLYVRLGDRERARELTQDTFMLTWMYLRKGNNIWAMRPFLFTTANNLFKNELRAKKETISLEALMDNSSFEPDNAATSQEEQVEVKMLISKIDRLPESYREVLKLRYIDGMSVKSIAAKLNQSAVAVSVRIHRGINKLRTEYYEKFA